MATLRHTPAFALCLLGCATAAPPQELLSARQAFKHAAESPAATLRADELDEAEAALQMAERAYLDGPRGDGAQTFAYIALRKAQLAEIDGEAAQHLSDKVEATEALAKVAERTLEHEAQMYGMAQDQVAEGERQAKEANAARAETNDRLRDAINQLADADLKIKKEGDNAVIAVPGALLFETDKASLRTPAMEKLNLVARVLQGHVDRRITIDGFTDSVGSRDINITLSKQRADMVRSYLVNHGVAATQVTAVGMGPDRPVADNSTPEGRADNRRVEILVQPVK